MNLEHKTKAAIGSLPVWRAYVQMHSAVLLWGFTAVLSVLITLPEAWLLWYRTLLATVGFGLMLALRGGGPQVRALWRQQRRDMWRMVGIGVVLMVHWLLFYMAVRMAGVGLTLVCLATATVFTVGLEPLWTRRRPVGADVGLSVVVIVGVGLLFQIDHLNPTGVVLALVAAVLSALYGLLNKPLVQRYPAAVVNALEISVCWLLATPLVLADTLWGLPAWAQAGAPEADVVVTTAQHTLAATGWRWPTVADWGLLAVFAWLCTNLAYSLTLDALRTLTPLSYALAINLEPIYGTLLGLALLPTDPAVLGWHFALGASLVLGAVLVYPFARRV